jgi:hypothetical protein
MEYERVADGDAVSNVELSEPVDAKHIFIVVIKALKGLTPISVGGRRKGLSKW